MGQFRVLGIPCGSSDIPEAIGNRRRRRESPSGISERVSESKSQNRAMPRMMDIDASDGDRTDDLFHAIDPLAGMCVRSLEAIEQTVGARPATGDLQGATTTGHSRDRHVPFVMPPLTSSNSRGTVVVLITSAMRTAVAARITHHRSKP